MLTDEKPYSNMRDQYVQNEMLVNKKMPYQGPRMKGLPQSLLTLIRRAWSHRVMCRPTVKEFEVVLEKLPAIQRVV